MRRMLNLFAGGLLALTLTAGFAHAQSNPCNPCGGKAANPCNPCGGKAANPCNPCGGKHAKSHSIAVNPCHAKHGKAFYVADPMKRNSVSFTSEAPLEDIVGTSNAVHGYAVFDPARPTKGIKGKFTVPVATLDTGIPLRDDHLQSPNWMHAEKHPHITFVATGAKNVREVKKTGGFATYEMTLTGPFTVRGKSVNREIDARVTYMKESERTRERLPGDLLAIRAAFNVPLAEHGVTGGEMGQVIGEKLSNVIDVEVRVVGSSKKPGGAGNPCNPCGGKAGNPCNPCGGK